MRTRFRTQRGATLLEAAITFIVFFTFLMAIIEFGRAYYTYQSMTNAAREGARLAVSPCSLVDNFGCPPPGGKGSLPDTGWVQGRVAAKLDSIAIKGAQVDVRRDGTTTHIINGLPTAFSRVTITYSGFRLLTIPAYRVTLQAKAEMRNETN